MVAHYYIAMSVSSRLDTIGKVTHLAIHWNFFNQTMDIGFKARALCVELS